MEIEIDHEITLPGSVRDVLDMHSFLNALNVLYELSLALGKKSADLRLYTEAEYFVELVSELAGRLHGNSLDEVDHHLRDLLEYVREKAFRDPDAVAIAKAMAASLEMVIARLEELRGDRYRWVETPMRDLVEKLRQFLKATEYVSMGRFIIQFPPDVAGKDGYLVSVRNRSASDTILAPLVLNDVIRDLVANSRKYSSPGTEIRVELEQTSEGLTIQVSDQGIGIPPGEIQRVVEFGYRATNSLGNRTHGGGFGLSKAYVITKRFNGRFLIESELKLGTTITMEWKK